MRNRNNRIWVRLNDAEFSLLKHAIEDSGLTLESYLRQLIKGYMPRSTPGPDYHAMIQALTLISEQLERIEQYLFHRGIFDPSDYQHQVDLLKETILRIEKQTLLPVPVINHGHPIKRQ